MKNFDIQKIIFRNVEQIMSQEVNYDHFHFICRVCMKQNDDMIIIKNCEGFIPMFEECTSLQESLYTKLPQQICNTCYDDLKNAFNFRKKCLHSFKFLNDIVLYTENIIVEAKIHSKDTLSLRKDEVFEEINDESSVNIYDDISDVDKDNTETNFENKCNESKSDKVNIEEKKQKLSTNIFVSTRQKSLSEILLKKYNIYDLTCNICNKELSTRATLLRHMDTHDTNRRLKYHCSKCGKNFYAAEHLKKHEIRHLGKTKYECELCLKRFYILSALGLHSKQVHKTEPIKCDQCALEFYHRLQLEHHRQIMHEKKEYFCDTCGKIFTLKCHLKEHQITHSKERRFTCNFCDKRFKHKGSLKDHMKLQHIEPERREMCNICGKLILPATLRSHLESHDKATIYPCVECGKIYTNKYVMRVHMKEKHTSDTYSSKYNCPICNKQLCSKGTLTTHMKIIHSNDLQKIKCHICGKAYKLISNLNVHIKNAHMDIRPHWCQTCLKSFHSKYELKNHMRSHTGERPFSCEICGKSFGFKTVLKTHMKVHSK